MKTYYRGAAETKLCEDRKHEFEKMRNSLVQERMALLRHTDESSVYYNALIRTLMLRMHTFILSPKYSYSSADILSIESSPYLHINELSKVAGKLAKWYSEQTRSTSDQNQDHR